ncbi:MAG: ATP-binding cassette domain-containing protein [Dehalococcoidales bacterium]|nr:MAG: ATP-binding cassette domain-containing protein [Dehalococcoidales bacterium]
MEEVIKIENLSFTYPDGRQALSNICLTITRGDLVAIIGPNGAGKSTLLQHLNGILHSNGAICILGKTLEKNNIRWIRSKVGVVFQNPDDQLFSPTVFDDVAFGPINIGYTKEEVNDAVKEALERVGMSDFEQRSPHHLSLGEKKRIAIATVLSMSPEILVFDEPTSNLDPKAKGSIIQLFKQLPATKIIATHDLDLVRSLCPRTVILNSGTIAADGATSEILANHSLLKENDLTGD